MYTEMTHHTEEGLSKPTPEQCLTKILARNNLPHSDGRHLYQYQLSRKEYRTLWDSLKTYPYYITGSYYRRYWAAGFCLFVSEWYRRDYNSIWSWKECERLLDLDFQKKDREWVVCVGIEDYWKRKIQMRGNSGRDLLGTLFFEGGLPWPLIKQDQGTFGKIVKRCIGDYYLLDHQRSSILRIVNNHKDFLPNVFKNEESLSLIVNIIDSLRHASETFDFTGISSPYEFIIKQEPDWKARFPLPLDDETAQGLVNEWLIDAGKKKAVRDTQSQQIGEFSCFHLLTGEISKSGSWITKIRSPKTFLVASDLQELKSTRMEMILYEGAKQLSHAGVVYAQSETEGVKVRIQNESTTILRKYPDQSLSMKFFSDGAVVNHHVIQESSFDSSGLLVLSHAPDDEDRYKLISNSSCSVQDGKVIVQLPRGGAIDPPGGRRVGMSSKWMRVEISKDSIITIGDEHFTIRLNSSTKAKRVLLTGSDVHLQTNAGLCFYGLPGVSADMKNTGASLHIHHESFPEHDTNDFVGKNTITLSDKKGQIQFKKEIGILPKGFTYRMTPKIHSTPASIEFSNLDGVKVKVEHENGKVLQEQNRFALHPATEEVPRSLYVKMKGVKADRPITIILPYPKEEVTLVDDSFHSLHVHSLHIDKLLGLSLIIHLLHHDEQVHLRLSLISKKIKKPYACSYQYDCVNHSLQLSLFSLRDAIQKLFSVVADQDAKVEVNIVNRQATNLFTLYITRYEGDVVWEGDTFSIQEASTHAIIDETLPTALNLSDPKQIQSLDAAYTEGVSTGYFHMPAAMEKGGPWLILPDPQSEVVFRPRLYMNTWSDRQNQEESDTRNQHIESLHSAARLFDGHDTENIQQIVNAMASDYEHSGWLYLKALADNCSHVPFSSFEVWLAVGKSPETLAAAIFRLDLDSSMCHKIEGELAVLWESICINYWSAACNSYKEWLISKGLSERFVRDTIYKKADDLSQEIPVFQEFSPYICDSVVRHSSGEKLIIEMLPSWFNDLRTTHKGQRYLEYLSKELMHWEHEHCHTTFIKRVFSNLQDYIKPTVYVPFFMAELTYGSSSLHDLAANEREVTFLIKSIIDFDRSSWYIPTYKIILNYLLNQQEQESS